MVRLPKVFIYASWWDTKHRFLVTFRSCRSYSVYIFNLIWCWISLYQTVWPREWYGLIIDSLPLTASTLSMAVHLFSPNTELRSRESIIILAACSLFWLALAPHMWEHCRQLIQLCYLLFSSAQMLVSFSASHPLAVLQVQISTLRGFQQIPRPCYINHNTEMGFLRVVWHVNC